MGTKTFQDLLKYRNTGSEEMECNLLSLPPMDLVASLDFGVFGSLDIQNSWNLWD